MQHAMVIMHLELFLTRMRMLNPNKCMVLLLMYPLNNPLPLIKRDEVCNVVDNYYIV